MVNILSKMDYNVFIEPINNFINKYKKIILISFLISIFINAIDIFTIKFSVDSEHFAVMTTQGYINQQRYGSAILYYILPFARFHILSQITGLIAIIFAALLTISRHNVSNNAKLLFVLLFVTYPNFAYIQYYYYQSAYNLIGALLVVIAYRITENNKNIILHIIAIFFLFIGISSYQTNMAVFLCVMMINVILDFINNKDYKKAIYSIIKPTLILLVSLVVYYIVIKIYKTDFNSYHMGMIQYSSNFINDIHRLLAYIWEMMRSVGYNGSHTANICATYILGGGIIFSIYSMVKYKDIKYNLFLIFLVFLFLLSVFSMNIVSGGALALRIEYVVAFYPAFILFFGFIYSNNKYFKFLIVSLAVVTIVFHSYTIAKNQTAYYMRYQKDVMIANNIINELYKKFPEHHNGQYKIVTFGGIANQYNHKFIEESKSFRSTFFTPWQASYKILLFLKIVGLQNNIKLGVIDDDMKEKIKNMPKYPMDGYMQLYGDTIIIKLGDY